MKKHILSNYLTDVKKISFIDTDDSVVTESIETSDPDEFRLLNLYTPDNTITHSIETSDPDEFRLDNTHETRAIETSDPDEFVTPVETCFFMKSDPDEKHDKTTMTFTLEQSDPDEFCLIPCDILI